MTTLANVLEERTTRGELWEKLDGATIRCVACGHRCRIQEGREGVCKVRYNEGGELRVPRGYVAGLQSDPIEKKPFFHAYPGARALSFGMLGCDFKCGYCQNWLTSQAIRDPEAIVSPRDITPEDIVRLALENECRVLTSTYNEPLITSEWAVEVFKVGREKGLAGSYVSNGNGTPEVIEYIAPWVDFYKIDLKSFSERNYRHLGGHLEPVLETIKEIHRRGIWLELLTLVVPGFNDSDEELAAIAEFIASVDPNIPWHVTAFHQDYKMTDNDNTTVTHLLRAWEAGRDAGLRFVYAGNIPGAVGNREGTHCPGCEALLVGRIGFRVTSYRIENDACPDCGTNVPGVWEPPRSSHGRPIPLRW